jgi:hypothetical protein
MKILVTCALVAVAIGGRAQNVIRPGDKLVQADLIKPSHDYYKNVATDTTGKLLWEFMMEDVTTIDTAHERIIFARSRQIPLGYFSMDTSITDFSLKPISMHEVHVQYNVSFEMSFGDTLATVTTLRQGKTSLKQYPMKPGYFEDNMIGYIFGALQLKKGVPYWLDNFNKDTPTPSDPYEIEYVFDDMGCSVIHFIHGKTEGHIWIDKGTHQLVKQEGAFKGGSYVITKV